MQLNATLFHIDWSDIQVEPRDPAANIPFTVNGGDAEINGLEWGLTSLLTDSLRLNFTGTWFFKHELTNFPRHLDCVNKESAGSYSQLPGFCSRVGVGPRANPCTQYSSTYLISSTGRSRIDLSLNNYAFFTLPMAHSGV